MSVVAFADGDVGISCIRWLLKYHRRDLAAVVTTKRNQISLLSESSGLPTLAYEDDSSLATWLDGISATFDIGLLIWWPQLVKPPLIRRAQTGFFNTHPSLLPYNRGKHYNFWALVEQSPFGVTIHRVETGIDSGPIVAQKPIQYDWTDTGGSLYAKAQSAMIELFTQTYPLLRDGTFCEQPQPTAFGSQHFASELDPASSIDLNTVYTARDLLNRLRARTFVGYPACRFTDDGETFEVRVTITRVT